MSTIDKKKASSSLRHSIKEHHDEDSNDNNKEKKNTDEILIEEIHTVNDWEHADLGNEQRKQKFLRLMGAKKRKDESETDTKDSHNLTHTDEVSSDRKHCRSTIQNESLNRELEKQFNESLQSTILHTHHEGLGFHSNEPTTSDDWHHQQGQTKFIPATTTTKDKLEL